MPCLAGRDLAHRAGVSVCLGQGSVEVAAHSLLLAGQLQLLAQLGREAGGHCGAPSNHRRRVVGQGRRGQAHAGGEDCRCGDDCEGAFLGIHREPSRFVADLAPKSTRGG